ncbi:MAG: hypothetical protein SVU32_01985, partial [Candidatus Nanohaloarchaea archaeon]|nr:hypothetical protein [Candidatus Nanohaloarchaea archaeon]
MGDSFDQSILEDDLRCKIIYYSSINPTTIAEINTAWGYSSPTYLYQNKSLERLKDADLIEVEKQGSKNLLTANYQVLFSEDNLQQSRDQINQSILQEYLIHSKGVHPRGDEDDRDRFLEMGRANLEQELEDELQELEFDSQEFSKLTRLWKTDIFRETFLKLDNTAIMLGDRKEDIPANPLHYLFRLTTGIMESINRGREEQRLEIPPEL